MAVRVSKLWKLGYSCHRGFRVIPWNKLINNAAHDAIDHSFVNLVLLLPETGRWVLHKVFADNALHRARTDAHSESDVKLEEKKQTIVGSSWKSFLKLFISVPSMRRVSRKAPRAPYSMVSKYSQRRSTDFSFRLWACCSLSATRKGFLRTKRLKIIDRFLPCEISILVICLLPTDCTPCLGRCAGEFLGYGRPKCQPPGYKDTLNDVKIGLSLKAT